MGSKTLKFESKLVKPILAGEKTSTWRLFDDKNLQAGDEIDFIDKTSLQKFARAKICKVTEKKFNELTDIDKSGHEKFSNDREMYSTYSKYYNRDVDENTHLKIIEFKLL